jgi:GxxExxY protein
MLKPNATSYAAIGAAIQVHKELGAGVLESAVDACLLHELLSRGLQVQHQGHLPVVYRELVLPASYRVDFIVEKCLLVEVKCVEKVLPVHKAQVLSYLRLTGLKLGLLFNFNVPHLEQGIHRVINGPAEDL